MKFPHMSNPFSHLNLPKLETILPVVTLASPLLGGGLYLSKELEKNPQGVKNSLYQIHDVVKKDISDTANFTGKNIKSVASGVGSVLDKLMLPLMICGGVVLIIMLKK